MFALHTDAGHPHVHLAVRALGEDGVRLNPRKADLDHWRQTFARTLRDRGVEAEATPRRARGITRKPERIPVRKLRERHEAGRAPSPRVIRSAYEEAAKIAAGHRVARPWERSILDRQREIRAGYASAAEALARSPDPQDRALAEQVRVFVAGMPAPLTRRNELVKAIRTLVRAKPERLRSEPAREAKPQGRDLPPDQDLGPRRRR